MKEFIEFSSKVREIIHYKIEWNSLELNEYWLESHLTTLRNHVINGDTLQKIFTTIFHICEIYFDFIFSSFENCKIPTTKNDSVGIWMYHFYTSFQCLRLFQKKIFNNKIQLLILCIYNFILKSIYYIFAHIQCYTVLFFKFRNLSFLTT